eukprot:Seg1646.11 transcript_id=Seg1646.11/GoldUCD/mRNA.D3Y31 product="Inactive ubiquitin carboxyl-terminal hydrolase 54" protein_id=Seg1646.11/GoldUCD/D3Y31
MTLVRARNGGGNFRQSVIMPSKGLLNNPGENNCFMNSAVQDIFENFAESDEAALPPDVLRIALAKAFQDQRKFQIGRMGDAAECFENILRRLHYHIAYGEPEDMCNAKHCIPHQKFSMQILEQTFCKCGATSEPLNFFQVVNYVAASALIEEARQPQKNGSRPYKSFGELMKVTSSLGETRQCPDEKKCKYRDRPESPTKMHRTLLNCPDIVGIGINWDTDRPSAEYVMDLLDCLGKRLEVKDLFDNVSEDRAKKMRLRLVGIMTYYGKHYTTFFYNSRQETWFYFDDARVKEVGKDWDLVKDRCIRGRYQPLLAFYVNQDGEPIKANKAPRKTKIVSKDELLAAQNNNESAAKRKQELEAKKRGKQKTPKKEKIQHDKIEEEPERRTPVKRKSFKKIVGSAFKKTKSAKPDSTGSSSSKRQLRYSSDNNVDRILTVNGHDVSLKNEKEADRSIDDLNDTRESNRDDDREARPGNSPVKSTSSEGRGMSPPLTPERKSPPAYEDSPRSQGKVNGRSPQSHRLRKHQQHLKSLETNIDAACESDYDNLDSPKSGSPSGKPSRSRRSDDGKETQFDDRKVSLGSKGPTTATLNRSPRSHNEQTDAFSEAMDEAESLIASSKAAENEGNLLEPLLEAFHLCREAGKRYQIAMEVPGITEIMRQYADDKRWDTQTRCRILTDRINVFRNQRSKSADYDRQVSKTSDYGSLSDASGSPLTPSVSEDATVDKFLKENLEPKLVVSNVEKGGIQARLNNKRSKADSSKSHPEPVKTKNMFFTLPRKSKSNKDKHSMSTQDQPTPSEMEQLSALLKDFDANDHSENRRVSRELNPRSVPHKSEPDLAKYDSRQVSADARRQMPERNYSVHMSQVSHPFFTGSEIIPKGSETLRVETDSPKIRNKYSEGTAKGHVDSVAAVSSKSVRSEVAPGVNRSEISYSMRSNGSHSNYELASKSSKSPPLVNGDLPRGSKEGLNQERDYLSIEILSRSPKVRRSTPEHHVDSVGKSSRSPDSKRADDRNINAATKDRDTTSPKAQRSRTERNVDSGDLVSRSPKSVHANDWDVTENKKAAYDHSKQKNFEVSSVSPRTHRSRAGENVELTEGTIRSPTSVHKNDREDREDKVKKAAQKGYPDIEILSRTPETQKSSTEKILESAQVAMGSPKSVHSGDRDVKEHKEAKTFQKDVPDIETLSRSSVTQRSNIEKILESAQVAMGSPKSVHSVDRDVREHKEAKASQKSYPDIRTSSKSPEMHSSGSKAKIEVEVSTRSPKMSPVNGQVVRESKAASNYIKYSSEPDQVTKGPKIEKGKLHMDQSMIRATSPKSNRNGPIENEEKGSKALKGKHKSPGAERRDVGQGSNVLSVTRGANESGTKAAEKGSSVTSIHSHSHPKEHPPKVTEKADYKQVTEKPDKKPTERKRSIFRVIVPKIMSMERVRSVKKSDARKKSVEAREAQYAAMLSAASNNPKESDPKKSARDMEPDVGNRSAETTLQNTHETRTVEPIEPAKDIVRDGKVDSRLKQGDESTNSITDVNTNRGADSTDQINQWENQTNQRTESRNRKNHGPESPDNAIRSDQALNQIESVTKEITHTRLFGKDSESPSSSKDSGTTTQHMNRRYQQLGILAGPAASVILGSKTQGSARSQEIVSEAETAKAYRRERSKRTDDPDRRLSIKSNPPERNEMRIADKRNEPRRSSITNSHSNIAERFSVGKNASKTVAERRKEFLANVTSQSQSVDLPKTSKSLDSQLDDRLKTHSRDSLPTSVSSRSNRSEVGAENNRNDFVTKSQPSIYSPQHRNSNDHRNSNEHIEPPPRKHPYVYRSSDLYKPKGDVSTAGTPSPMHESVPHRNFESQRSRDSQRLSDPQENSPQYGVELPGVPVVQKKVHSRWTNDVDFSKSNRQMCQQCGTVTVEKPRKFCRNCQSDYL